MGRGAVYSTALSASTHMIKRAAKRFLMELPLTGKYTNGGAHPFTGQTKDVSAGGVFFYCDRELAVGTELQVIFPLPPDLRGAYPAFVICAVEVVRAEVTPDGRTGVAGRVKSYQLMRES